MMHNSRNAYKSWGLLALTLFLIFCFATNATAQSTDYIGVDLIILIDQSGSMSGAGGPPTDPTGVRVSTAQYLVEYLHFDGAYANEGRENRITVIGFGSPENTHSMVGLTPLQDEEDVARVQAGIVAENLGNTSFISALRLVREQFPPETDSEPRRRIIIIITDGGPYDERAERAEDPWTYGDYFREIGDFYNSELGAERFPLYVINVDKTNRYWSNVVRHWENIAGEGHTIRIEAIEESNREIVRILCPLLNPNQPEEYCALADLGPHFVQPYARIVQFSFFKYDPTAQARLYRPGVYTEPVRPTDPGVEYSATQTNGNTRDEIYRIANPEVGCWLTDREGTGQVDVFVQVAFHTVNIAHPLEAHPQILPLAVELQILDEEGQPVAEIPEYPVTLTSQLVSESGNSRLLQMQPAGRGLYASSPVMLSETGYYDLSTEGRTTVSPSGLNSCISTTHDISIFQKQDFQIFVYAPQLRVRTPSQPYLRYGPVSGLSLEFLDLEGDPIPVPQNAPWTISLRAQSPSGEELDLPDPVWENGVFTVSDPFFLPENGEYTLVATMVDQSGVSLFEYQTKFAITENLLVIPGPNYPAYAPVGAVEVELQNEAGQAMAPDVNYPLELIATVTCPDGTAQEVNLLPTSEPSRFRGPVAWAFETPGSCALDVTGYTSLRPGEPEAVAFRAHREIVVSGNLPYFHITSPDETLANARYPLHRWFLPPFPFALRPMPVAVEMRYGTQPAQATQFFVNDPNTLFTLELNGPMTQPLTVNLTDISGTSQEFGTRLALSEPGIYTATFRLNGNIRGQVPTAGAWPPRTVTFELRDATIYAVAWWSIITLASLTVLSAAGWYVTNRFVLPPARGKLIMEKVGSRTVIDSKSLTPKHLNRFILKGKELGTLLQLKSIHIKRAQPLQIGRGKVDSIEGIEITVHTQGGSEVKGTLYAHSGRNTLKSPSLRTSDKELYVFRYEN